MSGPRRILRIITRLNVGGPTRHVRILMSGLDPARFQQLLVHGSCDEGEGARMLEVEGETRALPELVRPLSPWRDLQASRKLAAIMREWRPDIVHSHQGKAGFLARREAARLHVPAVHTYHGHTFEGYFGPLRGAFIRRAERNAARRAQVLICQSESQRAALGVHLGPAAERRLVVVSPAIEPAALLPEEGEPDLRSALGTPAGRRVILLPARLVPIKRPLLAVDLLDALSASCDVELWLAGEGPLEQAVLERADELALSERVRPLGWRPRMGSLLSAADLVLLTSAQEGTPLVLLEAMATGVPVASCAVGGVADLLGQAGILLDPEGAPAQWAEQLLPLLSDADRRELAASRGRERAAFFTSQRMLAALSAIYARILDRA